MAYKGTQIHNSYAAMRQRCNYTKGKRYKDYGGRGIKCEWDSFSDFLEDMGPSWFENATLDRIDNDGNYNKDNCRWADRKTQARNKRETKYTRSDIEFIRAAYSSGEHTQVELGKMFNDSQGNISNIITKRTLDFDNEMDYSEETE